MITLPTKIKTTMLKSFWIVFCTVSLTILSLLCRYYYESNSYLLILLIIPFAILPGYLKPESVTGVYTLFNRIIRKIIREFRGLTLRIMYHVFYFSFNADNNEKKQMDYLRKESAWELKSIDNLSGYEVYNDVAKDSSAVRVGLTPFIKWMFKTKNWSILPVLPFLFIHSFLTLSDEKTKSIENTYTLY